MLANKEDANKYIGKVAAFHTNRFEFPVKIVDVERARVRLSFLITPLFGNGMKWVTPRELAQLSFVPEDMLEIDMYKPD